MRWLMWVVLMAAGGCAYSSSETPRPLEPDYERVAQKRAEESAPSPSGEGADEASMDDPLTEAPESLGDSSASSAAPDTWGN